MREGSLILVHVMSHRAPTEPEALCWVVRPRPPFINYPLVLQAKGSLLLSDGDSDNQGLVSRAGWVNIIH